MDVHEQPEAPEPSELQFDHAEFQTPAAPAVACSLCQKEIPEQYYEINGKAICATCREALNARFADGSGLARFFRAAVSGTIAAALGCGIYYAVAKITGFEFSLIAILVGWMVGSAVRKGSGYRGGWVYQGLAIFLTYTAVVAFTIPDIYATLEEQKKEQEAVAAQPAAGPNQAPAVPPRQELKDLKGGQKVIAIALYSAVLLAIAYVLPFLAWKENLIGLLIIFFALQQAWYLNRKPKITITGPYRVGEQVEPGEPTHDVGDLPIAGAPADA
jgi:hypothetical protein